MSQANVEIVRRSYAALNAREFSRMGEFLDPDVAVDVSRNVINPGRYEGHKGFESLVAATDEVWGEFHLDPEEFIDAGDHVIVSVKLSGVGGGSGVEAHMDVFNVFALREGRIVRIVGGVRSREEAFEIAGLAGQG